MNNIIENINKILQEIPKNVKLVAVSKTKPIEDIKIAYNAGYKIFGENKVQELVNKYETLPKDIEWHMIGHLQTNKVKYIAPFINLIHAVDSKKLLTEINKQAQKNNRKINCLLQIKIAKEDTKFGLSLNDAQEILENKKEFNNITFSGLMGMATNTNNKEQILNEFDQLSHNFKLFKVKYFANDTNFKELSMGMSNDYKLAISQGSTIIRVGSLIFGERIYNIKNF